MCGIAGIVDFRGRPVAGSDGIAAVKAMLRSFSYRGPDESGIWHSPCATLGHVRLSISDLRSGRQPLADMSGRYLISFNGEIFNYLELRGELEARGIRFKTGTDTEVLVNLFALEGERCLNRLNGQFAMAIWDTAEERLFLARDRVGVRPLFYTLAGGTLFFASEIKGLFQNREVSREFDPENLNQIFTFWTTITPGTAFRDIYELQPGHFMTFDREGVTIKRFWELDFSHRNSSLSLSDAIDGFSELFNSAVQLRLRADVEVAAYLSGGIDSAATVATIKDISPGELKTFSIGFRDKNFDESRFQEEAVIHFGTDHHAVSCSSEEIAEIFPKVIWHCETPLTRTAPAPMMMLAKLAADNGIKVVITGEGSDEILAGYDIFREAIIRVFWASQPGSSLRPALLKRIYPDIPHLRNASPNILKMFFGYRLEETANPLYSHLLRWNNANHIRKHLSDELKAVAGTSDPLASLAGRLPESFMGWSPLARAQWLETTIFMTGYLLSSQGDRMAMAHSVEGRYPFLDHRVIEFCTSLPDRLKLNGLNEKYLLKKVMEGRIPENIRKRPKQPYRAPVSSVFLGSGRPAWVDEMLSERVAREAGVFNHDSVSALLGKIEKTGTASETDNMVLTSVISTHLIWHQFIRSSGAEIQNRPLNNLTIIKEP